MGMQSDVAHGRAVVPGQRGGQDDATDLTEVVCAYCGRPLPVSGYWGLDLCDDAPDGAHATATSYN